MTHAIDRRPGGTSWRRPVRAAALVLGLGCLATTTAPALADTAGDGSMHANETATTYRVGDDATIAFWCELEKHASKVAVEGIKQIYQQTELGNCTARPTTGMEVVLKAFVSGPYWFGDDRTPWSVWSVTSKTDGDVVFGLVPDNTGPHERDGTNL